MAMAGLDPFASGVPVHYKAAKLFMVMVVQIVGAECGHVTHACSPQALPCARRTSTSRPAPGQRRRRSPSTQQSRATRSTSHALLVITWRRIGSGLCEAGRSAGWCFGWRLEAKGQEVSFRSVLRSFASRACSLFCVRLRCIG